MPPTPDPLRIIGIYGKKHHGKDTVARMLAQQLWTPTNYEVVRVAFADHLKFIAMMTWGLTFEQVYDEKYKEVVDPAWGLTPRQILQRLGTDVARGIHKETWVRRLTTAIQQDHADRWELPRRHLGPKLDLMIPDFRNKCFKRVDRRTHPIWVVTDVRFPNEWTALATLGAPILRVVADQRVPSTDTHESETALDGADLTPAAVLDNNGSLTDLKERLRAVLPDLHRRVYHDHSHTFTQIRG